MKYLIQSRSWTFLLVIIPRPILRPGLATDCWVCVVQEASCHQRDGRKHQGIIILHDMHEPQAWRFQDIHCKFSHMNILCFMVLRFLWGPSVFLNWQNYSYNSTFEPVSSNLPEKLTRIILFMLQAAMFEWNIKQFKCQQSEWVVSDIADHFW